MNMMHHGGMCRCPHHIGAMVLGILAFVAGVLFFWTSVTSGLGKSGIVLGFNANYYFMAAIVAVIMAHSAKYCRCCYGIMKNKIMSDGVCAHGEGDKCEHCEKPSDRI